VKIFVHTPKEYEVMHISSNLIALRDGVSVDSSRSPGTMKGRTCFVGPPPAAGSVTRRPRGNDAADRTHDGQPRCCSPLGSVPDPPGGDPPHRLPLAGQIRDAHRPSGSGPGGELRLEDRMGHQDRKSTRLNSSHVSISY